MALLATCVVAAVSSARSAGGDTPSPVTSLDAEFSAFASRLPATGEIGFLDRYVDGGAEDAVRAWFTAQYALAPRIVVSRTGPEFLIVARGAARPGHDERLEGYRHVHSVPGGHRLFRKAPE